MRYFNLFYALIFVTGFGLVSGIAVFAETASGAVQPANQSFRVAQSASCGGTCGKVRTCRDAVYLWCVCGYSRADRDRDGIPCEKLCGQSSRQNLEKVQAFMKEFGCR